MITKLFEVRDRATFIPAIGIELQPTSEQHAYLLVRAGYSGHTILFGRLAGGEFCYDSFDWPNQTMRTAHEFVRTHWQDLNSGAVICTETIRGERTSPKPSERLSEWA
jgi:hypothetical protein